MKIMSAPPKAVPTVPGNSRPLWFFLLVIALGLAARMAMAVLGHNYDMNSYRVVAGILEQGGNVYASTDRYNYGPIWFQVLHVLDFLAGQDPKVFRYLVALFLSLVDIGICLFLLRQFGQTVACLFFLNPVSIIITGFYSQFDNLGILVALLGVWLLGDEMDRPVNRRKFLALVVIGLSITTKHILFAFPFWLAVKQKGIGQKAIVMLVPVVVFLLSFAPYWHEGHEGIIRNVFEYRSMINDYFYNMFVPLCIRDIYSANFFWFFCLTIFAFIYRSKTVLESLLAYTCVLVAFSPAIAGQYLAIPIAFLAVRMNVLAVLYTIFAAWYLLIHPNGLSLSVMPWMSASFAVCTLAFVLAWATWKTSITVAVRFLYQWVRSEIKGQFGIKG